eukprot:9032251-Alexandrium_andersonii.AAC.1
MQCTGTRPRFPRQPMHPTDSSLAADLVRCGPANHAAARANEQHCCFSIAARNGSRSSLRNGPSSALPNVHLLTV